MIINEIQALYDREERRDATIPGFERQVTPQVVRHVDLMAGHGFILYSDLTATNADAIIQREIAYFHAQGHNLGWKLYSHDRPHDLGARLAAHGFVPEEREAFIVINTNTLPLALVQPVTHDIRLVTDPAQLSDVLLVQEQVYDTDYTKHIEQLAQEMENRPDRLSIYIAYINDQPASAAWIRFPLNGSFAGLWGGSTVPEYRKRGLYSELLALRVQEAKRRGISYLTVDASPMSRPILEKHGFQWVSDTWPYELNT